MTGHDTGYANPNSAAAASTTTGTLFTRAKLYELVNSVVYGERLDPPVEYALLKVAEAFIVEVSTAAAELARHRHSHAIEARDIQLYLEREWDMALPGFVDEEKTSTARIAHPTVGHQTRMAHATRAATAAAAAAAAVPQGAGLGANVGHQGHHYHHHR